MKFQTMHVKSEPEVGSAYYIDVKGNSQSIPLYICYICIQIKIMLSSPCKFF